jgi:dihydroorotase
MTQIRLTQPDDWHCHVRDGDFLRTVVPYTARQMARAIIMPNLSPPVTTVTMAESYRRQILASLPKNSGFDPLMTLYLTDNTQPQDIIDAKQHPNVHAIKYYPAGATTNSENGVTDIEKIYTTLETLEEQQMPLLMHGEVVQSGTTNQEIDIFDREFVFIEQILEPLQTRFPKLRIVFEHITTSQAVDYVTNGADALAATITPQHLLLNRNAMLAGGIRPHHYCLPVLKREPHRQSLVKAATSGNPKFFLGTDSAPHSQRAKQSDCGCAGIFTAHAAIELYAQAFDQVDAIDKLENFASHFGPDFYRLPRNSKQISLIKQEWQIPDSIDMANESLIPFYSGQQLSWKLV